MRSNWHKYQGQAMVEALVVFLVLLGFLVAIPWLGRLHDIDLQQLNASRYGAFQLTRTVDTLDRESIIERFFLGKENNWRDLRQQRIVHTKNISIDFQRNEKLGEAMQAGMQVGMAKVLRQEWDIEDKGIARVNVSVIPRYSQVRQADTTTFGPNLGFWDRQFVSLKQHTAILTGAGHSYSDIEAHQHVAQSSTAWHSVANESYRLGRYIQNYTEPVDKGFGRSQPIFDWLLPWSGKLPSHHLNRR